MKASVIMKKIVVSALFALVGGMVVCGILGLLIQKEIIPISASKVAALVIVFFSVLLACLAAVGKMPQSKLTVSLGIAGIYILLQLALAGMLFPVSELKIGWTVVLPLIAAVISGVWSSAGRKRR